MSSCTSAISLKNYLLVSQGWSHSGGRKEGSFWLCFQLFSPLVATWIFVKKLIGAWCLLFDTHQTYFNKHSFQTPCNVNMASIGRFVILPCILCYYLDSLKFNCPELHWYCRIHDDLTGWEEPDCDDSYLVKHGWYLILLYIYKSPPKNKHEWIYIF